MVIDDTIRAAFSRHALADYPREAVGLVAQDTYIPCVNAATSPTEHFRLAAAELAVTAARYGRIQALLHSHPYDADARHKYDPIWPSHHDMTQWMKGDIPWGIAKTDGVQVSDLVWLDEDDVKPLYGRTFVHGITDCYSIIRDWYKVNRGITLKNYARGMEWWQHGHDYYSQYFGDAGFYEIDRKSADVGDVVLISFQSPVINHAGVIIGSNSLLHQPITGLSCNTRLDKWDKYVSKYVRYSNSKATI